ncbi:MAG: hypothetical protein AAF677_17330 [Pseudomonadota bacterium]
MGNLSKMTAEPMAEIRRAWGERRWLPRLWRSGEAGDAEAPARPGIALKAADRLLDSRKRFTRTVILLSALGTAQWALIFFNYWR